MLPYDFIHVVPPMRAPDAVKNSELAWKEGPFAEPAAGSKSTRPPCSTDAFRTCSASATSTARHAGKTAATVKKSAPLVARHLVQVIAGGEPGEVFDGYTSCPLLTREGSALLIEFDYEGRLTPTLPMVDPLQDSFFAWMMKTRMLKPAYLAVLKGRV